MFVAPLVAFLAVAVVTVLAGCGDDAGDDASAGCSPTTAASSGSGDSGGTDPADGGAVPEVRAVDTGLRTDAAVTIVPAPQGDALLVAERAGRVVQAEPDGDGLRAADQPVIDVTDLVGSTDGERGLLGLAVAPDGGHLYLSYTAARRRSEPGR